MSNNSPNPLDTLYAAIDNENLDIISTILKTKPNLNVQHNNSTPLIYASEHQCDIEVKMEILQRLVDAGADVNFGIEE